MKINDKKIEKTFGGLDYFLYIRQVIKREIDMKLKGHLEIKPDEKLVVYRINDFQEPLTKEEITKISEWVGGAPCTIKTNAGVELHSVNKGVWKGITIERL